MTGLEEFSSSMTFAGIGNSITFMDSAPRKHYNCVCIGLTPSVLSPKHAKFGQDVRITVMSRDRLVLSYTSLNDWGQTEVAELSVDAHSHISILKQGILQFVDKSLQGHRNTHKNLVPFKYGDDVFFIDRINPLTVVRRQRNMTRRYKPIEAVLVSRAEDLNLTWSYGWLRGGTNAIQIDEDRYLAIFHSHHRNYDPDFSNNLFTYYMGAFTFSSRPPFHLLEVSTLPIVHEDIYNYYPPFPYSSRRTSADYCVFPMGLFETEVAPGKLFLSIGVNDLYGAVLVLDKQILLEGLTVVGQLPYQLNHGIPGSRLKAELSDQQSIRLEAE